MARKRYVPDHQGLAELGRSADMEKAIVGIAREGAAAAQAADRRGDYVVTPQTVTEGFRHERRAGAMIEDQGPDSMGRESEKHTLNRVAIPVMERGR